MGKGNQDIMSSLDHKIIDSKFRGFYTFYETSGCSSRKYQEYDLKFQNRREILNERSKTKII